MSSIEQIVGTGNGLQNISIIPANNPSSNSYSFAGNNIVVFNIPSIPALLDPESIRVTGNLRFTDNQAMEQDSSGATVAEYKNIHFDQYLGINSCWRSVQWSATGGSRASIEKVSNYGQLLNCILPALNQTSNYQNDLQINNLSTQNNRVTSDFILRNAAYFKPVDSSGSGIARGINFSCPIYTGVTMSGQRINLGAIQGLTLQLELQSDNAVFFTTTSAATNPQAFGRIKYELTDLKLECNVYNPTAKEQSALMNNPKGIIQCNTFTSLFSVVQASQSNIQYNLGIKELVSFFFKFNPTKAVNNLGLNEFQASRVLSNSNETTQFTKLRFMRSGVEFPILKPIEITPNSEECELNRYYQMALKNVNTRSDPKLATNNNTNDVRFALGATNYKYTLANQILAYNKLNSVYGIGYDMLSSMSGADFNFKPLTVNLECNLTDGNTNAFYGFALAKTTIAYDESGITVVT